MDKIVLIISALLLNILLAGPKRLWAPLGLAHYFALPASFLRHSERKLNRSHRSLEQRKIRGLILVMAVMLLDIFAGWICTAMFSGEGQFFEIILLAMLLPVRQTWDVASQIHTHLRAGNIVSAKMVLEGSSWRHYMLLDEHGIARAGIEMLAVQFSEKVIAPIFWYVLLGLPGLFISRSLYLLVETLSALAADDSPRGFGDAAITTHFFFHYIPARITALLWAVVSVFSPASDMNVIMKDIVSDLWIVTPQSAVLTLAANAVGGALGGPASAYASGAWLGTGTVKITTVHLRRAMYLFALLQLFLLLGLGLFL